MAANEYLDRADQFTLTMPTNGGTASPANPAYVLSPHAPDPLGNIGSGDPLIWGLANSPSVSIPLVAQSNYNPPGSLTPDGQITVKRVGANYFIVIAKVGVLGSNKAINPGDAIYATPSVIDTTSGIASGIVLSADNVSGYLFGHAMVGLASGQTGTIPVMIGDK
jgi:hypothetical protein